MVPNVPMPSMQPDPVESPELFKTWVVALLIEDPERKRKIQLLSETFGMKPGPYLTQVILNWIDTIDIDQVRQEALPMGRIAS